MAPDIERHSMSLLEWLHDNDTGGPRPPNMDHYLTQTGMPPGDGFPIVRDLAARGLVEDCSGMYYPRARITAQGRAWFKERRRARADPAQRLHRINTLHARVLWWFNDEAFGFFRDWKTFLAEVEDAAEYQDNPFTENEFTRAMDYLSRKGLISGLSAEPLEIQLTASGRDCITDHGGNVSDYLSRGQGGGNTTNNITMTGSTGNITVGNENVVQNVNETQQVAPGFEAIAEAVADTLRQLPAIGLPEEDQQDAEAVANDVLAEVVRDEPNRGRIRRWVATLRGYLAPVAAGAVLGAEEGAQELARKAIEHLGSSF